MKAQCQTKIKAKLESVLENNSGLHLFREVGELVSEIEGAPSMSERAVHHQRQHGEERQHVSVHPEGSQAQKGPSHTNHCYSLVVSTIAPLSNFP